MTSCFTACLVRHPKDQESTRVHLNYNVFAYKRDTKTNENKPQNNNLMVNKASEMSSRENILGPQALYYQNEAIFFCFSFSFDYSNVCKKKAYGLMCKMLDQSGIFFLK